MVLLDLTRSMIYTDRGQHECLDFVDRFSGYFVSIDNNSRSMFTSLADLLPK